MVSGTEPGDEDALPFAEDDAVVPVDSTDAVAANAAVPVSAEFEQGPDTALDLFGSGLGDEPERTLREPAPAVMPEEKLVEMSANEVKIVVGRPDVIVGRPESAPVQRQQAQPAQDQTQAQPQSQTPTQTPPPKFRPKLLNRAIVERNRNTPSDGKKDGSGE